MNREDLFKAMDGLPDELLLRSEGRMSRETAPDRGSRKSGGDNKVLRRRIPWMMASSAALGVAAGILFMVLAGPLLPGRRPGTAGSAPAGGTVAMESQEEIQSLARQDAETAEEEAVEEAIQTPAENAAAEAPPELAIEEPAKEESPELAIEAPAAEEQETPPDLAIETPADSAKTSADLLGSNKGDYVKVEYISAEDKRAGGSLTEPAYSEEGEEALSSAISKGTPKMTLFGVKEEPLYYIYLTKKDGSKDELIVYEEGTVTSSSMPGFAMSLPTDILLELEEFFGQ